MNNFCFLITLHRLKISILSKNLGGGEYYQWMIQFFFTLYCWNIFYPSKNMVVEHYQWFCMYACIASPVSAGRCSPGSVPRSTPTRSSCMTRVRCVCRMCRVWCFVPRSLLLPVWAVRDVLFRYLKKFSKFFLNITKYDLQPGIRKWVPMDHNDHQAGHQYN